MNLELSFARVWLNWKSLAWEFSHRSTLQRAWTNSLNRRNKRTRRLTGFGLNLFPARLVYFARVLFSDFPCFVFHFIYTEGKRILQFINIVKRASLHPLVSFLEVTSRILHETQLDQTLSVALNCISFSFTRTGWGWGAGLDEENPSTRGGLRSNRNPSEWGILQVGRGVQSSRRKREVCINLFDRFHLKFQH